MNIPCCIYLQGTDKDGWSIEFPMPSEGRTETKTYVTFQQALDGISEIAKEFNIKLKNYKLVVNL